MSGDHLNLDAIEARAGQVTRLGANFDALMVRKMAAEDVPALVAEVRRLRADREMGRTNLAHYSDIIDAQAGENAALRARFRLCSGCDATLDRCNAHVEAGAIKCCPDCHHAA